MENDFSNSSVLYRQARQSMDEGKLEKAIMLFQQSISIDPHFKALELLGECYFQLNQFQEAIVPLAAATTLNKGVRAPSLLAEVFLKVKDYSAAKNVVEIALSRDSNNRKALEIKRIINETIEKA